MSASPLDTQRKLPPALEETKLPPLSTPFEKGPKGERKAAETPLVTVKFAPTVPLRQPAQVGRDIGAKMPPRPQLPARRASRHIEPVEGKSSTTSEEITPAKPPEMCPIKGFGNKQTAPTNKSSTETETPN